MSLFDSPQGMFPESYAAGKAEGMLAAKADKRADNADAREQSKQNMAEEAFGWQREDREKEKQINMGMVQAAQAGGYEGVISFLEKNDPEKAISFTKMKLSLDRDIMGNDVMKATSKLKKDQAMIESYGLLGKMGSALINAPPQFREAMYKEMLPMVKQVNPNAPDDVLSAVPMFMLSMAQATPVNQLFKYQQGSMQAESAVGKVNNDIQRMKAAGVSEDDDAYKALVARRDEYKLTEATTKAKLASTQNEMLDQKLGMEQKINTANQNLTKQIFSASSDFKAFTTGYSTAMGAVKALEKDPNNPSAQIHLGYGYARMINGGGVLNDADVANKYSAAGFPQLAKKMMSIYKGQVVDLNPDEINFIKEDINSVKEVKVQYQKAMEDVFKQQNQGKDNLIDWDNRVTLPSKAIDLIDKENGIKNTVSSGQVPPELQAAAEKAIASGKWTPQQAAEVVKAQMAKMAQQTEASQPKFTADNLPISSSTEQSMMNQIAENQKQIELNNQSLQQTDGGY